MSDEPNHPLPDKNQQPQPSHPASNPFEPLNGQPLNSSDEESNLTPPSKGSSANMVKTLFLGLFMKSSAPENPLVEITKTISLSVLLALGIRTFVAEARWIPSGSMRPTLIENDRLIVDKVTYRFGLPQRGDIVVFNPTDRLKAQDFKDAFIKRVIGLPGEEVQVNGGRVYINGQALRENYIEEAPNYQYGPTQVPADQYLVLGDNRNNSYDSHYWGFVPRDRIIGRAVVRFWPPRRVGGLNVTSTEP